MSKFFFFIGKLLVGGAGTQGGIIGLFISAIMFLWAISDIVEFIKMFYCFNTESTMSADQLQAPSFYYQEMVRSCLLKDSFL